MSSEQQPKALSEHAVDMANFISAFRHKSFFHRTIFTGRVYLNPEHENDLEVATEVPENIDAAPTPVERISRIEVFSSVMFPEITLYGRFIYRRPPARWEERNERRAASTEMLHIAARLTREAQKGQIKFSLYDSNGKVQPK